MSEKFDPKPETKTVRWWQWGGRVAIFFFGFLIATLISAFEMDSDFSGHGFVVGEPATRTVFSPFDLSYIDEITTEKLRQEKAAALPPVYVVDPAISQNASKKLEALFTQIQQARNLVYEDSSREIAIEVKDLPLAITETSLQYLLRPETAADEVLKSVEVLLKRYMDQGVLDYRSKLQLLGSGVDLMTVVSSEGGESRERAVREIPTPAEIREQVDQVLPEEVRRNRQLYNVILDLFHQVLTPNLRYDEAATQARRQQVAKEVKPVEVRIQKGELVVQRGVLVSPKQKQALDQVQKKITEKEVLKKILASSLLVFLAYVFCFLYLLFFERKILLSFSLLCLIHTVFLITLISCKIVTVWRGVSYSLMPFALASVLLALLTKPRLGILSAVVMTVLAAPLSDFRPEIILAGGLSALLGTFAAIHVRKRLHFFRVAAAVGISHFLGTFAFFVFQEYGLGEAVRLSWWGIGNGLLVTSLAFLSLPFLESVFNLVTDITLLELSDLNHPLLKRMVVEAPGTYHHSLVVSNLAESACKAIGANALLARVGCYFHDIGKIPDAEFFTENLRSQEDSKHHKLTPTMSFLVIINHVKRGVELGRRYKLRQPILNFITEHQGTGVVYYFYRKALDHAAPGETVKPDDFRYPGPRPQSRETAVALLADSTEAASRSLKHPTPESLREVVRKVINEKFIDGQLEECDLTLKDLNKIQESFVHNLMAIYHTRVEYPAKQEDPNRPDLFGEKEFSKFRLNP